MTARPLPIRVKYHAGETLDSYAQRLAHANHTTVTDIEHVAHLNGWVESQARNHPDRTQLWERLAALAAGTIPQPATTGADKPQPHPLCIKCTHGIPVLGWLTNTGVICLKHKTAHAHSVIAVTQEQLRAERDYRRHLAPEGLHPHHRLLTTAHHLAQLANQQPASSTGTLDATRLLNCYPDTVRIAIELTQQAPATRAEHTPRILKAA